jgi:GGDEF domain-containing protein
VHKVGYQAAVSIARLCDELIRPARVGGTTVTVGASIGVAVAEPGCSAADLTRCADIAMYSAKAQGKNRVERFAPDQQDAAVEAA